MTQIQPSRSPVPPGPQKDDSGRIARALDFAAELFETPSVTAARFVGKTGDGGTSILHLSLTQRSLSGLNKRAAAQSLVLGGADLSVVATTPLVHASEDVKHVSLSSDGTRQALFRVIPAKEGKEARKIVEIVRVLDGRKEGEIEVTKEHGDFYFDPTFGPPSWHASSTALVYTAEAPPPKPDPSATRPSPDKFEYEPDFGETFTGKRVPTLFLLVLDGSPFQPALRQPKPKISVHRLTSPDLAPPVVFGQPAFLPDTANPKLVATGYAPTGDERKLGIVYCTNRPARIYALELAVQEVKAHKDGDEASLSYRAVTAAPISAADRSARSPRVLPAKSGPTRIVYLSNTLGGPHASCAALQLATLSSSLSSEADHTVVPVVDVPDAKRSDPFPGLYVDQLPQEPFLVTEQGETAAVMTSVWRSRRVPLVVGLESGSVTNRAPWPLQRNSVDAALPYLYLGKEDADELASLAVLGTDGDRKVVAVRSAPNVLPTVVVLDARIGTSGGRHSWKVLRQTATSDALSSALSDISYTILPLPKFEPTELILISPIPIDPTAESHVNLPPLVVIPHGGPHGASTTDWSHGVASLVLAGYRVVLVAYPGSIGFGQQNIDVLPPRLGELEVEATLGAGHYLNALSLASRTRGKKLLMGGSHGGWIACHLTARWPDEFDAVVQRNPVTDLVANASMTDIPDWCFTEADVAYPLGAPPAHVDPETYMRFHDISPLRHAGNVKTPTLLLIGLDDRRVPPNQGRTWYHALKRRPEGDKVDVEMLTFPGNGHPIDSTVEAEWVAFEQGVRWLARYTSWE